MKSPSKDKDSAQGEWANAQKKLRVDDESCKHSNEFAYSL